MLLTMYSELVLCFAQELGIHLQNIELLIKHGCKHGDLHNGSSRNMVMPDFKFQTSNNLKCGNLLYH